MRVEVFLLSGEVLIFEASWSTPEMFRQQWSRKRGLDLLCPKKQELLYQNMPELTPEYLKKWDLDQLLFQIKKEVATEQSVDNQVHVFTTEGLRVIPHFLYDMENDTKENVAEENETHLYTNDTNDTNDTRLFAFVDDILSVSEMSPQELLSYLQKNYVLTTVLSPTVVWFDRLDDNRLRVFWLIPSTFRLDMAEIEWRQSVDILSTHRFLDIAKRRLEKIIC